MVGELNFGAGIPQEVITNMQKEILLFQQKNKDGYIARTVIDIRPLGANIRKDVIFKVDKTAASDGISVATISADSSIPDVVGTKGKDVVYPVWRIADAILMGESEIALNPARWNSNVRVAMQECLRRENYTAINGDATRDIIGIVGAAQANPLGSIVASGGSGKTVNNAGAWDGSETDAIMDPYDDLRKATGKINPEFPRSSLFLGGRPEYLNYLWQKNELRETYISEIAGLFGRADGSTDFLVPCDYFPENCVYVISKNMNAAELTLAQDYNVDANYPREKGQNRYAEIGGWLGFNFYDYRGFVQVAIN